MQEPEPVQKDRQNCSMVQEFLIALGSNLGDGRDNPLKLVKNAISELARRECFLRSVSRFFVTPSFPAGAGPDYINACIALTSGLSAAAFLQQLHDIEADFGRERVQRWGSRTLDLDLIAMGDAVMPSDPVHDEWRNLPLEAQKIRAPDELILPHPRMHERAFVLVPLCDIAPNWRHPVLGITVRGMTNALPQALRDEVRPV